jgi:phytoene dehydrogenase-like protein
MPSRCQVLERRGITGGAAVTEELIPGFKFSRASYLAGLLRPVVVQDLELEVARGRAMLGGGGGMFVH